MAKKHCMFQCALQKPNILFGGYLNEYDFVEDTDLITWDKALELWNKHKPKVIAQLENGGEPEMAIWTGCDDKFDYHTDPFHINGRTVVKNGEFIETKIEVIDPNKIIMGTPV